MPLQPPAIGAAASPLTPHLDFIKPQLPSWLMQAPAQLRASFRRSLIYSNQARHDLKALLDEVQSPEAFARQLLRENIQTWFFSLIEDENAILSREWKNSHLLGLIKNHARTTRQTLLEAALQNFEASEAKVGGIETGTVIFNVTDSGDVRTNVSAVSFARLCRDLDIGGLYFKHLQTILEPAAGASSGRSAYRVQDIFTSQVQHAFGVALHIAYMKQQLTAEQYLQLSNLQGTGTHRQITFSHLTLDGVVLPSVLVIQASRIGIPFMLYTPEDPSTPLRQEKSLDELKKHLAERLLTPAYQTFFKPLVPLQHQGNLLNARPSYVGKHELVRNGPLYPASLDATVSLTAITSNLFTAVARQRIKQIKHDARIVAVPTADVDMMSRQKRLQSWIDLGKSVLYFAASFVPVVGEVLLVVTAAQVLYTVYEGFAAWSRGDSDEALNDLLDLVDTAAMAVATAGATRAVGFGARLVKVKVRNKGWRLWSADLKPYRHPDALPEHLLADRQGLYKQGQQHYVKLDDHAHAVKRAPEGEQWELVHPTDSAAYRPSLLSNGVGGWRQTHEAPAQWDDLKLIKRLGPDAANITQPEVEPILLLSGLDKSDLRDLHQSMERPPPLLRDTLNHFNLEQEINAFDLERADGSSVSPYSPLIQFHLLVELPEWPADHVLTIVDGQQQGVMSHGAGKVEIKIDEARFRKGELLHALEQHMPQAEFNKLLINWYPDYFTKVESIASRLTERALEQKQRLLERLTTPDEKSLTATQTRIRALLPQLSKSHLEELQATLTPEQQLSLQQTNSLPPLELWEAQQYEAAIQANRAQAGIFLDSMSSRQSVQPTLYNLERVPGWPGSRIDVYDASREGELLGRIGPEHADVQHTLIRQGERYSPLDSEGKLGESCNDLPSVLEQTLSTSERTTLLDQSGAGSIKEAIRQTSLSSMSTDPAIRANAYKSPIANTPAEPLDTQFAVTAPPAGLTAGEHGIYQVPAQSTSRYRQFILDNQKYYAIKQDPMGWRLVDARSPYRFYQPYLRKKAAGGWEIDPGKGRLLGGQPPEAEIENMESSDEWVSASSTSQYDSAEEGTVNARFTRQEWNIMRNERNYQHSQNYLRVYDRANNGRYPLRDMQGRPMRIRQIQSHSTSLSSSTVYKSALIRPYIEWEGFQNIAQLYEDNLEVTPFTAAHQKFPQEAALIGQATVIARKMIKKGAPLGVYGGEAVPLHVALARKDPYLMPFRPVRPTTPFAVNTQPVLSGDNVLSRINTIFEYDAAGIPIKQAAAGYNTEAVQFRVTTQVGETTPEKAILTAVFASEDIAPGSELRWNYQYSESTIRRLFPQVPQR